MKHHEQEVEYLKDEINQMWRLVISQLTKSKEAFMNNDTELALEIISLEKRVNAFELKIDSHCEKYIALYNPVAIDLRFVLSIMKISITLERIADYACGIARYVANQEYTDFDRNVIEALRVETMFDVLLQMMTDGFAAFNSENAKSSRRILLKDKEINEIYRGSSFIINDYLRKDPTKILSGLRIMLIIRNMERIGDHCSNIVEEFVFYIEAKVLKHKGKIE